MSLILAGLACWSVGAILAWVLRHRFAGASWSAAASGLAGPVLVGLSAWRGFSSPAQVWMKPWSVPYGSLALRLDPLAAVFLLPVAVVGGLGAVYGVAYFRAYSKARSMGSQLAAYNLLLVSLAVILLASNVVLFLLAWELMTLLSWFLVVADHDRPEVRSAGILYLTAGHIAGAGLILFFAVLAPSAGEWNFMSPGSLSVPSPGVKAGLVFLLALIGFGTKAAIAPFHVWLPDAHAAAPSHVSGLMSGVLITMGFYGLMRFLPVLGQAPAAWGFALMGLGCLGACGGISMALTQTDVKRILAYSTVENAGIVVLAMGSAMLFQSAAQPLLATLAWTAALLHIWNHAAGKSLLFFGFGGLAQAIHNRDIEAWGGVMRRVPVIGSLLLLGGAALVGLPGLGSFVSEWLLLLALLKGTLNLEGPARIATLAGTIAVALTGAIALACFVRLIGVGLLGEPRREPVSKVTPPAGLMIWPMVGLGALCLGLAWLVLPVIEVLLPAVRTIQADAEIAEAVRLVHPIAWLGPAIAGAILFAYALRRLVTMRKTVRKTITWDCGYARPAPSMQYTATSLAQPITRFLQPVLRTSVRFTPPQGLWPGRMSLKSETPERALAEIYRPGFDRISLMLSRFTQLQEGRVTVYLRYVVFALLLLIGIFFLIPGGRR